MTETLNNCSRLRPQTYLNQLCFYVFIYYLLFKLLGTLFMGGSAGGKADVDVVAAVAHQRSELGLYGSNTEHPCQEELIAI